MSSMWRLGRRSGDSGAGSDALLSVETPGCGHSSPEAVANVTIAYIYFVGSMSRALCLYHKVNVYQ